MSRGSNIFKKLKKTWWWYVQIRLSVTLVAIRVYELLLNL